MKKSSILASHQNKALSLSLSSSLALITLCLAFNLFSSRPTFAQDTILNITSTPAMSLTTSSNNIVMDVEPTSTGSFQTTPLIITAGTNNPNGYTLYFSVADNNTNLAGNNGNISALDNNGTTGYTPSTFTMNRWGYSIGTIASPDNDTTIYHPAPTITSPTTIDTYVGTINSRITTINLATKVDFATAAGSYSKQLVVSMLPTIATYELIYNKNTTDTVANLPDATITEQWSDVTPTLIINTSKIPTRNGYNFKGYTTTNGGTTAEYAYNATTGAFAPSTLTPSTTSSTLYAVWEEAGPKIITFTIDGESYQAEEGMTWYDWMNSDYNTDKKITVVGQDSYTASLGYYAYKSKNANCDTTIIFGGSSFALYWNSVSKRIPMSPPILTPNLLYDWASTTIITEQNYITTESVGGGPC